HRGEIFTRLRLLLGPHGALPRDVAMPIGIAVIKPGNQPLCQLGAIALLHQAVIGPGPLGIAPHQASIGQQLEMARNARLALSQNLGEILDRVIAISQQCQQAHAGPLTRCLEHTHQFGQFSQFDLRTSYKDIFISTLIFRSSKNLPAPRTSDKNATPGWTRGWRIAVKTVASVSRWRPGDLQSRPACGTNGPATARISRWLLPAQGRQT